MYTQVLFSLIGELDTTTASWCNPERFEDPVKTSDAHHNDDHDLVNVIGILIEPSRLL